MSEIKSKILLIKGKEVYSKKIPKKYLSFESREDKKMNTVEHKAK